MVNTAKAAKPIAKQGAAGEDCGLEKRCARQSGFRGLSELINVAPIIELARFRVAENRGGPRNLRECEMHHVIDIGASPADKPVPELCMPCEWPRVMHEAAPRVWRRDFWTGFEEVFYPIDPWEHPVRQPAVYGVTVPRENNCRFILVARKKCN